MTRPQPALQTTPQARANDAPAPRSRAQLANELAYYEGRLAELRKLDPHDFTGLSRTYQGHVELARRALAAAYD